MTPNEIMCPWCAAQPWEQCTNPAGKPLDPLHMQRMTAARETTEREEPGGYW
jgi:hypothetical protein